VRALLALHEGDREAAMIETQMLVSAQPDDVESALVFSIAWSPVNLEAAHIVMRRLFHRARSDPTTMTLLLRLLEDFPLYEVDALPGSTVSAVMRDVERAVTARDVMCAAYPEDPQGRLYVDVARALKPRGHLTHLAVIGGALDSGAPALRERHLRVRDFVVGATASDATTTQHASRLLNALGDQARASAVDNAVVLTTEGGTLRNFGRALLWAADSGAEVVLAPLSVDIRDEHLLGIVRYVSGRAALVAAPVPEGSGTSFPGLVEPLVTTADLPHRFPSQYVVYAHPTDFPNGYVLREWLITPQGTIAGEAWSAPTLTGLREALPDDAQLIAGQDPTEPKVIEVWM
jgi:hypothetical protein